MGGNCDGNCTPTLERPRITTSGLSAAGSWANFPTVKRRIGAGEKYSVERWICRGVGGRTEEERRNEVGKGGEERVIGKMFRFRSPPEMILSFLPHWVRAVCSARVVDGSDVELRQERKVVSRNKYQGLLDRILSLYYLEVMKPSRGPGAAKCTYRGPVDYRRIRRITLFISWLHLRTGNQY